MSVQQLILTLNAAFRMVLRQSHLLEPRRFYKTNMQYHTHRLYIFLSRIRTVAYTKVSGQNVATWRWETVKLNINTCDVCPE
jgi:hypothetical protein